ncbi:MAG TPA: PfkB family carbohydrate kinase, partial [Pirellulaceae bacterium]|nr:PfkB family carbohydrate kinase [Pirellulaceae bacterium]
MLGSINVDLVVRGDRLPTPGETILGGRFFQAAGGKGANQAVAAARLGLGSVVFIAAVGDDDFGRAMRAQLSGESRLDLRFVRTAPGEATGVALILVDSG